MATQRLTAKIRSKILTDILAEIPNCPVEDQIKEYVQAKAAEALPSHLKDLLGAYPDVADYLGTKYVRYPFSCYVLNTQYEPAPEVVEHVRTLRDKHREHQTKVSQIRDKLNSWLGAARTLKALRTSAPPELLKYIPSDEEGERPRPQSAEAVGSLANLGWPVNG